MQQNVILFSAESRSLIAQARRQRKLYFVCKRLLDVLLSSLFLLVLSPLMGLIALLIVLDTPGPALFRQERVGLCRRRGSGTSWTLGTFVLYKFRTMYRNAEPGVHRAYAQAFIRNDQGAMAALQGGETEIRKIVEDDRVTRLGRFLRKSSLDELPQFWNVLRGDMSLVGPRPPIPYEVDLYEPWHFRRLEAIPGLTGLWQVMGRSSVEFEQMVRLDIEYFESQSFILDLKILLKTPLVILRGDGAV